MITCIWKREVTLLNVDRISFGYQPIYVYSSTGKQELFDRSSTGSGLEIMQNNRFCTFHDRSILCFIRVSTGRTLIQPAEHMVLDEGECKMTPSSGDRPVDRFLEDSTCYWMREGEFWRYVRVATGRLYTVDRFHYTVEEDFDFEIIKNISLSFFIKITSNSLFLLIWNYIIIFYFIKNKLSFIVM